MVPRQEEVRIGIGARIRSLPLLGLVLLGAMSSGFSAPLPAFLRFLFAFAALVWIPGAVIHDRLLGASHPSAFVRFPLRVVTGISFVSIVTWLFVVGGARIGVYSGALQWLLGALYVAAWAYDRRTPGPARRTPPARSHAVLLVALGAFAALQPALLSTDRDAYDHIGYIREIVTDGALTPAGVLAPPVAAGEEAAPPRDPRKGTFHDVLALVCRLAGIEPIDMWRMLPALLFPFAFFAFVGFCRVFVDNGWGVFACCVLFAISYGGVGYRYAETAAYGQNLAVIWYWLLVPLLVSSAPTHGRARLVFLALLGAGGAWVHFGVALHVAVLAATLLVFARGNERPLRSLIVLCAATFAAALWKVAWLGGTGANVIHTHPQGLLYVTPHWFVVSPLEILRQHGLLFLGGIAMTPLIVFFSRARRDARRELAFAVIPLTACFIPFITVPLVHAASYMVSRTLLNVAVLPMVVTGFACTVSWGRRRGWGARAAAAVILVAWSLVFFAPTARAFAASLSHPASEAPITDDALARYVRGLPAGSAILSDPATSYELSAVTNKRFVAVSGQHGNPADTHALDRLEAVRDVLSPFAVSRAAIDACDRYGVDFVVVNENRRARAVDFLSLWDATSYQSAVDKLSSIAGRFREVYRGASFVVFLYDPGGEGSTVWGAPATPIRFESGGAGTDCRVAAPGGEFAVESVSVTPGTVLPGETVQVTIGYTKPDRSAFGLPYSVSIRFDNDRVDLGHGIDALKFVRRARERSSGKTLRYTLVHRPFAGLYDVDLWPIGVTFYETFSARLPAGLAVGGYDIRVAVERGSLLPNFTLGDLLFNNDRLSGRACGRLEVAGQRMRPR